MSGTILIQKGRIIDPGTGKDEICDLLLKEGRIAECKKNIRESADYYIDAEGCYVMPGLIDMHVHLRDPGQTDKEDIVSGFRAAARGGFTTIVAMANTRPVIDSPDRVDYVMNKADHFSKIHILQAGAATKGMKGTELADLKGMKEHGIPAISEDGKSVMNSRVCREMLKEAAKLDLPFLDHCEDADLAAGGCVNEDEISAKEGLPGIPNDTENVIIARDIMLAHAAGAHLHLCHCSTAEGYVILRVAREQGYSVTGEVCPHHFTLTSADRVPGDTNYKMNPPLRTERDRAALLRGLKEDVFDVISTDHAPHTAEEKAKSMREAPFGIVGLETAVPLVITELVKKGILTPMQMAEKMSANPAKILHLEERGSLEEGKEADVVIIDPDAEYCIDASRFLSKGKNTPFGGRKVSGAVRCTICGGEIVWQDRDAAKRVKSQAPEATVKKETVKSGSLKKETLKNKSTQKGTSDD